MWFAGTVILGALCVAGAVVTLMRVRGEVRFKTYDEVNVVQQLMVWSAQKLSGREGQRLAAKASTLSSDQIVALQSISRDDLAALAPFIDEWIVGHLPPQNLPAEYEDFRPRTLLGFKQRLQSKGLWPER
ncbi:hypothetical protein ACVIGA_000556 [Bradyrhizobium sp. USDA 3240]